MHTLHRVMPCHERRNCRRSIGKCSTLAFLESHCQLDMGQKAQKESLLGRVKGLKGLKGLNGLKQAP
jgi:hypothetical protein